MSETDPVAAFRVEAGEVLEQVEQGLLDLGHRLDDHDLIDAVFRGLHTLKGSGAMFGFDALASFTHHCETAFDRVRKNLTPATPQLIAVILSAQDHMRALIDGDGTERKADGDAILAKLQAALDGAPAPTPAPAPAEQGWRLSLRLPAEAMQNGINPLTLLDELRTLGDCRVVARTEQVPLLGDLVPTHCMIGWDVELRGAVAKADIEDVFIFVMDDMDLQIEQIGPALCDDARDAAATPAPFASPSAPDCDADTNDSLPDALAVIRAGALLTRQGMSGLDRDAGAIHDIVAEMTSAVDCETAFAEPLSRINAQLEALAMPLVDASKTMTPTSEQVFHAINAIYTMAQERHVHRRFLPGDDQPDVQASTAMADADDFDGLF